MPFDPSDYTQCVAAYKMDTADVSGTSLTDDSGNGNTGTLVNSPTTGVAGKIGQAIALDGTNQLISLPSGLPRLSSPFSIGFWIKVNTVTPPNDQAIITTDWSVTERNYLIYQNDNTFVLLVGDGSANQDSAITSSAISAGIWYHVVAVINGTTHTLYLNGIPSTSTGSYSGGICSNNRYVGIDYNLSTGYYLNGIIDDLRFYDIALTSADIAALYAYTGATLIQGDPLFF